MILLVYKEQLTTSSNHEPDISGEIEILMEEYIIGVKIDNGKINGSNSLRNCAFRKYKQKMSKKLYCIIHLHKDTRTNFVYFIPDKE